MHVHSIKCSNMYLVYLLPSLNNWQFLDENVIYTSEGIQ